LRRIAQNCAEVCAAHSSGISSKKTGTPRAMWSEIDDSVVRSWTSASECVATHRAIGGTASAPAYCTLRSFLSAFTTWTIVLRAGAPRNFFWMTGSKHSPNEIIPWSFDAIAR
jgi:hypothetical protein